MLDGFNMGSVLLKEDLVKWLKERDKTKIKKLLDDAYRIKVENIGNKVYLRGLIEISNICQKDCYYCGLRCSNKDVKRYELTDSQVLNAARFAMDSGYGSLVLQGGERDNLSFVKRVTSLVKSIKEMSGGSLGITLSLGEQSADVYREWFDAGAHRYLLRIESSNPDLYYKIHPRNSRHSWEKRYKALCDLKEAGYQTGTGVMIGLPYQKEEDLANDLLFMKEFGIHMVGMGPYLKHSQTPIGKIEGAGTSDLTLTLKMVALLRHLMPNINIAATTAMQVVDSEGREKAVFSGANIIMPNMTETEVRGFYQIYENKPGVEDDAAITKSRLEKTLASRGIEIGWDEWGDSKAYLQSPS